jgi:DNA-binding NarL/FixJ family response regulator
MTTAKSRACRESGQARVELYPASCDPSGGRDCHSGCCSVTVRREMAGLLVAFGERNHATHNVIPFLRVAGTHEPPAARWTDGVRMQEAPTRKPGRPRLRRLLKHGDDEVNPTLGSAPRWSENQAPRERILIVEDNPVLARVLVSKINQFGGEGVAVGTVREALRDLAESAQCAAVILDLCLPDGPGVRVLEALRNKGGSDLPVLVLTGNPDHPAIDAAYEFRAQILEKPATSAQLEQFFRCAQQDARRRWHVERAASSRLPDWPPRTWRSEDDLDRPTGEVVPTARVQWEDSSGISSVLRKSGVHASPEEWLVRTLAAVEAVATQHKLSQIERDVLAAAVQGKDRRSIIEARQISPNTLKTQIHRLLIKTGHFTLDDLRDTVLRSLSGPEGTHRTRLR